MICEATLRVRPLPAERALRGRSFRSFAEGCEALRAMEQAEPHPTWRASQTRTRPGWSWRWRAPAGARGAGPRYLGHAATRAAAWHPGLRGDRDDVERRRQRSAGCASGRRLGARATARRAWGDRYAGPTCATAPRPRRDGRDARDRHRPGKPGALYRGSRGAGSTLAERGTPPSSLPRVAPLPLRRLALLHVFRPRRGRARPVGGREGGRLGGDHRRAAARSPTTTPSAATTPAGCPPRWARWGSS